MLFKSTVRHTTFVLSKKADVTLYCRFTRTLVPNQLVAKPKSLDIAFDIIFFPGLVDPNATLRNSNIRKSPKESLGTELEIVWCVNFGSRCGGF